jgi:DNA-binding SARP family transcriptional activator
MTSSRFVGRDHELAALVASLPIHRESGARLILVTGEAGVGKTRLVTELQAAARASGHQVAWGQCWNETGTPPYWPWTQVVRRLQGVTTGIDLASLVMADADSGGQARADLTTADAFALFDATATELGRLAAQAPLLIMLDDLHRADPDTLQLIRFVLDHLLDAPVMVVATYRPEAGADRADMSVHLDALRAMAETVELGGLAADAVGELIGDTDAAEGVLAVTGGNPLFVEQLVRGGALASNPPTVSAADPQALGAVLRARIEGLDTGVLDLLAVVSVLGPEATPDTAARLLGADPQALALADAELRRTGLIEPDGLQLAHALVADAVAAVVAPDRLAALHFAMAELCAADGSPAAALAHHLRLSGPEHWAAAVDACRSAAEVATASFSHAAATAHLSRALDIVALHPEAGVTHFEVAFELAGAIQRAEGSLAAESAYEHALELARSLDDPALIAQAAARHGIAFFADGSAQLSRAADCRASLADTPTDDSAIRARLLAHIVAADPMGPDRMSIATEAVAMARRLDDPETLGIALVAQQLADLGPSTLAARLRSSREIIAIAETCGDAELAIRGHFMLMNALLEAGDLRELDATLLAQDRKVSTIAERRFDRHALWFRCMRATLDGRALDAERLAAECLAISQELQDPDGFGVYTGQCGVALWLQGRLDELAPVYVDLLRDEPDEPLWPAVLGWVVLKDQPETARGMLELLPPPAELPQGMHTLLNLFTMADVAVAVGDDDVVTQLRDVLLPFADHTVPIAMGAAFFGVVARPLGHLAIRLGRLDEGIAHFERAIRISARMGARPWLADAQIALTEVLVDAGRGDEPRVQALVGEAAAITEHHGLALFTPRLERLRARLAVEVATPPAAPEPAIEHDAVCASVAVLGTFEVRSADGAAARWTSRKARSLLKILVARRGTPIAREELMNLLWPDEDPAGLANRMAVAVSTVRRALDPDRSLPVDALVRADAGSLRLMTDRVDVDVEVFLRVGAEALAAHNDDRPDAPALLHEALYAYQGEALPDEPYEAWADALRSATTATYGALLRAIAARAAEGGDPLTESDALRKLIELDPYDEPAYLGLIEALQLLGAHGQAQATRTRYFAQMAHLGIEPADGSTARSA